MLKIDLLVKSLEPLSFPYYAATKLKEVLVTLGCQASMITISEGNFGEYLRQILQDPPDCTLSFCNFSIKETSQLLCEQIRIPHLFWTQQAPHFYLSYLRSRFGYLGCTDYSHTRMMQETGLNKIAFLPHAVDPLIFVEPSIERIFEVVLFEDLRDHQTIWDYWKKSLTSELFRVLEMAIALVEQKNLLPVQAFVLSLKEEGISIEQTNYGWLLYEFEEFLKAQRLIELIQTLKDVRIDIFGKHEGRDWLKRLKNADHVYLHATVAYAERFKILKKSKILIRDQCFQPDGSDDWVLNGLAMGCLVITNGSKYLKHSFQADEELIFYPEKNWNALNELIHDHSSYSKRNEIICNGQKKARLHSWESRGKEIIQVLKDLVDSCMQ